MREQALSARLVLRLTLDVLLIVFGTCVLVGAFDILDNNIWLPLVTLVAGIFILAPDSHNSTVAGLILIAISSFLLLREIGLIERPWLSYFIGGFCVITGAVNIVRNATGEEVRLHRTFTKTKSE